MEVMSVPAAYQLQPPGLPDGPPLAVAHLYDDFARALREGGTPRVGFGLAVEIHETLDAIQRSSDTGQRQLMVYRDSPANI